jgi:uncharacterized protein YndB with AHSA1/START domain
MRGGSVTVHMAAPADRVWDLVSDVTRIGEFSPETFEAEWLGDATGPAVGARFRGHVRRNDRPVYWTVCTVTACDPGRQFGFDVAGPGDRVLNTWRYQLSAGGDGGTDVTESFELPSTLPTRLYWLIAGSARGRANAESMRVTLEKIKTVVESG